MKPLSCELTIRRRKIELGIINVDVKFKPQLTAELMAERKEKAQEIIDVNADPKKLCVSYDEANIHEAGAVPLGACYEVFPKDKDDVPIEIQFANADKAITEEAEEIRVSVKKTWKISGTRGVQEHPGSRLRNMAIAKVDNRNFYDESMTKTINYARAVDIFRVFKTKSKHGVLLGASKAIV